MIGKLLIAKPYLGDPNFERSVVILCDHSVQGAFGLVLNQTTPYVLSDFFEDVQADIPVGLGGPVENNTLHFIHTGNTFIEGSIKLSEGLYWSGNFEQVKLLVNTGLLTEQDIRFYIGYSGWGELQLEGELKEEVWILANNDPTMVFQTDPRNIWSDILRKMGGEYKIMANSPADPRLN